MLSRPRRLALSWRAVRRCSVRCLMRSVRSAIWTSGEPVSLSSRRYAVITSVLLGSVADGTRCPFLILWIPYSLMSLPDGNRSDERSKPRKQRGGLFGALSRVGRGHVPATDHHQNLGESGRYGLLSLRERLVRGREPHRDGTADRGRVPAGLRASRIEGLAQRDALFERGGVRVPHVRVPRGEPQHPLPLRAYPDGRVRSLHRFGLGDGVLQLVEPALEGGPRFGPEELHRLERFVEHRDAIAGARERKAELRELRLVPARADPKLEASVREVVDGDRDLRHESRMPVEVARHVQPHPRALRNRGHRREHGPSVEDRRRRIGAEREKMVEWPDVIESRIVGDPPDIDVNVDRMDLLRKLQAVAKRVRS